MVANESKVWRLVHRTEFEAPREPRDIKKWQIVRILLQDMISDFTGIVKEVGHGTATVEETTGIYRGRERKFELSKVTEVVEILSSPLFYELRQLVAGEKGGRQNIT